VDAPLIGVICACQDIGVDDGVPGAAWDGLVRLPARAARGEPRQPPAAKIQRFTPRIGEGAAKAIGEDAADTEAAKPLATSVSSGGALSLRKSRRL